MQRWPGLDRGLGPPLGGPGRGRRRGQRQGLRPLKLALALDPEVYR